MENGSFKWPRSQRVKVNHITRQHAPMFYFVSSPPHRWFNSLVQVSAWPTRKLGTKPRSARLIHRAKHQSSFHAMQAAQSVIFFNHRGNTETMMRSILLSLEFERLLSPPYFCNAFASLVHVASLCDPFTQLSHFFPDEIWSIEKKSKVKVLTQ